jgi:hypothetical protein
MLWENFIYKRKKKFCFRYFDDRMCNRILIRIHNQILIRNLIRIRNRIRFLIGLDSELDPYSETKPDL